MRFLCLFYTDSFCVTYLTIYLLWIICSNSSCLPAKIPDNIKSAVIQQWLQGKARDLIAFEIGLSTGAVTNIINEWRRGLSYPLANELRELAITFKNLGITATQCALGFKLAMIMINFEYMNKSLDPSFHKYMIIAKN
jgi:hypothetical protein